MLEVTDLHAFYGKAHILRGIDLSVARGEVVALLGRNGAGKSTTLKSIMQILPPRRGRVAFRGADLVGRPAYRAAKAGLGYVPEDRRVFTALTVAENLEVGRQPPCPDAPSWTADRLYDLFPNLAERRANRARALSGGEQQMLSIARTLMGNPALLLLDEPSEGIAPVIVEALADVVTRLKAEGLTVLLSEQNLRFARAVADRAVVLEGGGIRFSGSFTELESRPDIRDATLAV